MVVNRLGEKAAVAVPAHDAAVIFVSEVLPRLGEGVVLLLFGVSYPNHSNFVQGGKYADAAQFLLQAALGHNALYTMHVTLNQTLVARRTFSAGIYIYTRTDTDTDTHTYIHIYMYVYVYHILHVFIIYI